MSIYNPLCNRVDYFAVYIHPEITVRSSFNIYDDITSILYCQQIFMFPFMMVLSLIAKDGNYTFHFSLLT